MMEPIVFVKLEVRNENDDSKLYYYLQPKQIDYFVTIGETTEVYFTPGDGISSRISMSSNQINDLIFGIERYSNQLISYLHNHTHVVNNAYIPQETKDASND